MSTLVYIILATFIISAFSLVGIVVLYTKETFLNKILFSIIGLSTGTLLGGAFFHLLPESTELLDTEQVLQYTLVSFVIFFLIEKVFHWRHCHEGECDVHAFGYTNLIGDAIHNFIDGLIIAAAFITDVRLGVVTSIALAFHEIPQEIGDFGVLIYAGIQKNKALAYNFLVALTAVLGGIVGFFLTGNIDGYISYLLPFAAGGFLYIATSDLIPELRDETNIKRSISAITLFLIGLVLMYLFTFLE